LGMITRKLQSLITSKLHKGKAIVVMGPRQVGKTTLLRELLLNPDEVLWLSGDEPDVQLQMADVSSTRLRALIGNRKYLVIDEAQRIENIGIKMKLVTDNLPEIQLLATGSSSFELANKINEPLTGRKWEYRMFPLSFEEMCNHHGLLDEQRLLSHRLVFGYYPEIVTNPGQEIERLKLLTDSYLYKDILTWESIQKPDKLTRLLQALAFQVGSQVSYNELGQICGLDSKTVEKYVLLLEQCFIIFRLNSFGRNLRNELTSSKKIYFYDNGIRNALTANFNPLELRNDVGALWENFLMAERMKFNAYNQQWFHTYFWKTRTQQEIDYLEEGDGKLYAYEFKWNPKKASKLPKSFEQAYPGAEFKVIHRNNVYEFLLGKS
jgi:uncharacterized protein